MAQQVSVEEVKQNAVGGVFPPTEGGTVSVQEGTDEAKPVGTIPRKAAEPVGAEVALTTEPVLGVSTQIKSADNIAQVTGEAVAAKVAPSFETMLETAEGDDYMRLLALQERSEAGDTDAQMEMLAITESKVAPGETVKPYVEGQQVVIPANITNIEEIDRAKLIGEQSLLLDNLLRESVPDPRVRQVLVDNGLADFGGVVYERLSEMGRGTTQLAAAVVGQSPLNTAAYYGGLAAWDAMTGKASSFSTAYASYGPEIQRDSQAKLDALASVLPGPTLGMATNDFIRTQLQQRVEDGLMSQEEYDEVTTEVTADGKRIDRLLISDEAANNILQLSFNQLPLYERFGAIAVENVVGMAGFGAGTAYKGKSTLNSVRRLKEQFPELAKFDDPVTILQQAHSNGQAKNLKMHFLNIGLREERIEASVNGLLTQTSRLDDELSAMRRRGVAKGHSDWATYVAKEQQKNVLESRLLRAKFTGKTIPMVRENVENSLIISAGQLAAREFLPKYTDFDEETSEFFGALGMSLGGYQAVQYLGRGVGRNAKRAVAGNISATVTSGFGRVMDFFAFVGTGGEVGRGLTLKGKSLFSDDGIKVYEQSLGRRLTAAERRGITYATRLVQNMNPDQRRIVLKATDDYLELQERIISRFPEGDTRQKAQDLFTLSFAQASAIGPLAALNHLATGKITPRDLKNFNSQEMIQHTRASERQIEITERALKNLEDHLNSVPEMEGKEFVQEYIADGLGALQGHKVALRGEYEDTLAALDDLEKFVFDDVTVDLPEDLFANILYTRKNLKERLGQAFDMKQEIINLQQTFEEGLSRRISLISDMRGQGQGHAVLLARTTEDIIDTHMESLFARGRAAYEPVVAFSEGRAPIDMTPLVADTIQKLGTQTDIELFFSAGGDFFNGKLGKQALEVFNNMVKRVLPPEELDSMRQMLRGADIDDSQLTDIEVALRAENASDALGIFSQANPYEVEVMRRAFRDYAYRLGPDDKDLKRVVNDFAADLNTLIKTQDREMFDMLEKARITYRDEVGDRLRPQQILSRVDRSRQGPEKISRGPQDPFKFAYGDIDPVTVFRPISNGINKLTAGGRGAIDAEHDLPKLLSRLTTDFGERVVIDGVKQSVFDLSTAQGKAKFDALRGVISERVFADWGEQTLKAIKQPKPTRTSLEKSVGGYDFTRTVEWDKVQDFMMVTVKNRDGSISRVPIVNIQEMMSSENDLVSLMQDSVAVRNKVQDFISEAESATSQLRRNADTAINNEKETFDILKPLIPQQDPDSFYRDFVTNGNLSKLDGTRGMAIELLTKSGKTAEEAETLFDNAVGSLISRALMNRGGLQNVQGRTMVGLDMDTKVVRQFTTPENMLKDIQDNREMLNAVLGEDHVSYLEDITDFLNMAADTTVATSTGFQGITRGYALTEYLSRIYNVARGMVSPLYVTSEAAVRLASQANVEMFQLVGADANAARIVRDMFKFPELITREDMDYLDRTMGVFVVKEMQKMGLRPSTYVAIEQIGTEGTDEES
mgnify:CR=1 FL=1